MFYGINGKKRLFLRRHLRYTMKIGVRVLKLKCRVGKHLTEYLYA